MSATDNWNVIVRAYGKRKKKNYYARRGSKHGCDRLRRRRRCSRVRCRKHTSGTSAGGARRFRYWRAMMFRHAPSWPPPPPPPKNRIFRSHAKKSETCARCPSPRRPTPAHREPPDRRTAGGAKYDARPSRFPDQLPVYLITPSAAPPPHTHTADAFHGVRGRLHSSSAAHLCRRGR